MLRRLSGLVSSLGWRDSFWLLADRVLCRTTMGSVRLVKYYFVAQPVKSSPMRPGTMHLYVTDALDDVIRQAPRPVQTLRDRFAQGARCVVAERDGKLAGFIWFCPESYREDVLRCEYCWTSASGAVWDFDVYIHPDHRMGRLFSRLWSHAHAALEATGARWTLSRIDAFNPVSLAAHRRLGAKTVARGWFLIAGPSQMTVATVSPYVHLSVRASSVPRMCFDLHQLEVPSSDQP
jgi:hypothetical protein